ncbi:MAG: erythromycin esterase family protein [Nitrososphaerales archaeon]
MKGICIFCSLFFVLKICFSQTLIKAYVKDNAKLINTVDPNDTSYSDLTPIGKVIGEKRIVMLGELFHGDGTTFLAKTRIIKYLHEKLGFNILAFESDFFGINSGWESYGKGQMTVDSLVMSSIFPIWTCCKQCKSIFAYIKQQSTTNDPLRLAGFDSQLISLYTMRHLKRNLNSFLDTSNIAFVRTSEYPTYISLVDTFAIWRGATKKPTVDSLIDFTSIIIKELREKYSSDNFEIKVIESLHSFCQQLNFYKANNNIQARIIRDSQMAKNLKWLVTQMNPNEKIIVWAHDFHISKTTNRMGYYFTLDKELNNQTYVLGFTEYSGEGRFVTQQNGVKVTEPLRNSLEYWLKRVGYPFAYIDFSKFAEENPGYNKKFYMKTYPNSQAKSEWYKIYDGVFYIERMIPCEPTNGIN